MILVFICTISQSKIGIYYAVQYYITSWFIYFQGFPVFPGGMLINSVLLVNLIAGHILHFKKRVSKIGIWLIHLGVLLLIIGAAITHFQAQETQMLIDVGEKKWYSEDFKQSELAIIDHSDSKTDTVYAFDQYLLLQQKIQDPALPFQILILESYFNAFIQNDKLIPLPITKQDNKQNFFSAKIQLKDRQGTILGTYTLSAMQNEAENVTINARPFSIQIRPKRFYYPFSLSLKKFVHEKYLGTEIPKKYASILSLENGQEKRDVTIFMNHPLRYQGYTFFQASFGKGDQMTILQVVKNPAWTLPYWASIIMALGMLIHFGQSLYRSRKK
jgi:hypothetical protein